MSRNADSGFSVVSDGQTLTPLSLFCHLSGEDCSGGWVLGPGTMRNLLVTALILLSAGVTTSGAAVLPSQKQVLDTFHQVPNVYLFFQPRLQ